MAQDGVQRSGDELDRDASDATDATDAADVSVRAWLAGWGAEVAAADIRSGRRRFHTALSAFGTHADVVHGREQVEAEQWSKIWPAIEDFAFDVDAAQVLISPDRLQAVVAAPWTSTGVAADGTRFDRPGRATVVLRRDTAAHDWVGVHTHFSLARGVPQQTHGTRQAIR